MPGGRKCIVLIGHVNGEVFNKPLNVFESEILLTASKGIGFEEKGFFEFSELINTHNSSLIKEQREKKTG